LTRLGSLKGVEVMVRVVAEPAVGGRCCNPDVKAPAGFLCDDGFGTWERWPAADLVASIAGPDVFAVPTRDDWRAAQKRERDAGGKETPDEDVLARAGDAFRTWWEGAKERLTFDAATGQWSVGR
jgi:hypothetical protein